MSKRILSLSALSRKITDYVVRWAYIFLRFSSYIQVKSILPHCAYVHFVRTKTSLVLLKRCVRQYRQFVIFVRCYVFLVILVRFTRISLVIHNVKGCYSSFSSSFLLLPFSYRFQQAISQWQNWRCECDWFDCDFHLFFSITTIIQFTDFVIFWLNINKKMWIKMYQCGDRFWYLYFSSLHCNIWHSC